LNDSHAGQLCDIISRVLANLNKINYLEYLSRHYQIYCFFWQFPPLIP